MTRSQKIKLFRILLGASLLIAACLIPAEGIWKIGLFLLPYLIAGYDTVWKALRGCLRGQIFDEARQAFEFRDDDVAKVGGLWQFQDADGYLR